MEPQAIRTTSPRNFGLGDPESTLGTDPRSDPRIVSALTPFGMNHNDAPSPIRGSSPLADQLAHVRDVVEPGNHAVYDGLLADLPPVKGVTRTVETIEGVDGRSVALHVSRPDGLTGPLPCALQIHGGAMVFLRSTSATYVRHRDELAAAGMVSIGVDYRKAGVDGHHPYPAGLDDCMVALEWVHEHRAELGISAIVLVGDSGGANLAIAMGIRAVREGRSDHVDGVYAMVPYISGAAAWPAEQRAAELPSWAEVNGYFYCAENVEAFVAIYDPGAEHARDPLAWPYFATLDDLVGLPPHVISVAELDPVRDEGIAFHRKLLAAGVDSTGVMMLGACHVADLMLRDEIPDLYLSTVSSIKAFADRRAPS